MKLAIRPILVDVWRVYRARWQILIPLSLLVLAPQAVADALLGEVRIERIQAFSDVAKLASIPLALAVNLGGEALYAGITAALVIHWRSGRELTQLVAVAREIPYLRLIAIDVLLVAGTIAGLVVVLAPGIIFFTYLLIAPALIEINKLRIRDALRQSVTLVRGSFWRVLGFAVVVLIATEAATTVLEAPLHGVPGEVAFNLGAHALLEPFQGLATVLLAIALMERHGLAVPVATAEDA